MALVCILNQSIGGVVQSPDDPRAAKSIGFYSQSGICACQQMQTHLVLSYQLILHLKTM